jgi:hypothetical protein
MFCRINARDKSIKAAIAALEAVQFGRTRPAQICRRATPRRRSAGSRARHRKMLNFRADQAAWQGESDRRKSRVENSDL